MQPSECVLEQSEKKGSVHGLKLSAHGNMNVLTDLCMIQYIYKY